MMKRDFKKEFKHLYTASPKEPTFVEVPKLQFAMLDGRGDPNNNPHFQEAVAALYGVSYTLKFMLKKGKPARDYGVMPLEGLWYGAASKPFDVAVKTEWLWTLLILQPDFITADLFSKALDELAKKRDSPSLAKLRLEEFTEGAAVQMLHIGPYATEPATVQKMHAMAEAKGYALTGKHHEIYLGDPRRTKPEKLKTILRQGVTLK